MNRLGTERPLLAALVGAAALGLAAGAASTGCGGDNTVTTGAGGAGTGTSTNSAHGGHNPQTTGSHTTTSSSGQGGDPTPPCTTDALATASLRGAAIAVTPDDKRVVSVNRGAGTITIFDATYDGSTSAPTGLTKVAELTVGGAGSEPWQVAIDGCGTHAYVALRKDQQVVVIDKLDKTPEVGHVVDVGSEPTSLALTADNKTLYVSNWVDGTLTKIDPHSLAVTGTVNLNAALVASPKNYLGANATSRPSLAHPRSIAITNTGDVNNDKVYVTEFFGQRIAPEPSLPAGGTIPTTPVADVTHEGVLYAVNVSDDSVKTISLDPLQDTGFKDSNGNTTGCYPNQLQGVTINGDFAYVTAVCASPQGPLGVFQNGACTTDADCGAVPGSCNLTTPGLGAAAGAGACKLKCTIDSQCGAGAPAGTCVLPGGSCKPVANNIKTTTHPVLLVVDTTTDTEVAPNANTNLNNAWFQRYQAAGTTDDATRRFPLVANELSFVPGGGIGYMTANGADAVFRITTDATGLVTDVGISGGADFIDLSPAAITDATKKGQGPVGIGIANNHPGVFTDNGQTLTVTAVDLTQQQIAGGTAAPVVAVGSALPTNPDKISALAGKRFFETGMGRWSFKGQGWGACQVCHIDGLTDNVTWYFNRGPRQSVSLDGTFDKDPASSDQRVMNWTGIFDEVADFENNTRGVSGGIGALVALNGVPPAVTDRLNLNDKVLFPPDGAVGLAGSTADIDDGTATNHSAVANNWKNIADWIKLKVRSPRAPTNLDPAKVTAGLAIFKDGNCQGCHGGAKWTVSKLFYKPSDTGTAATNTNHLLLATSWAGTVTAAAPAAWPQSMLPATAGNQFMRSLGAKAAAFDQITCVLRNVGTFAVSPADVNVQEVRQDQSAAQGAEANGNGFNSPSLLNLQAGAPYFHAGNARTLEEMFAGAETGLFKDHTNAIHTDQVFLAGGQSDIDKLVAYLLSIDADKPTITIPAPTPVMVGGNPFIVGGDFCSTTNNP